jgi:hypothetical protein
MTAHQFSDEPTYYKAIPVAVRYRAGSDGSVWSAIPPGERIHAKTRAWRRLRPQSMKDGHLRVTLGGDDGISRKHLVHRVILETFVGPCPPGMECCHADGDPANNRLSNLRWDTRKGNMADAMRHGTVRRGEAKSSAKLTESQVIAIREAIGAGEGRRAVAERFGITASYARDIAVGVKWAHVASGKVDVYDRKRHLRRGAACHTAKLTEEDVREIRRLREEGLLLGDLATRYGVSTSTLWAIITRTSWTHI